MKKPYFLNITRVYDEKQEYEEQTESKLFTPFPNHFYAYKNPGETITVEVEVGDLDIDKYCAGTDVDLYCGEAYGRV